MLDAFIRFFDVNTIFFTLLDYPISYLEFFGTLLNIACVILIARRNIWTWPVGIVATVFFGILFYQIQLYADFFEQIYFLLSGFVGWWMWFRVKNPEHEHTTKVVKVTHNPLSSNLYWLGGIILATMLTFWVLKNIHVWLPSLFPEPASLPLLDAGTTMMSFAAQILMIQRRIESWYLWIVVDIIGIGLYWYKAVPFVALLYVIFLINAFYGLYSWRKSMRQESEQS